VPKLIDSQALGILNSSLGLTGAGSGETELLDGTVDQSLDVNEIVRRGRTPAGSEGIFRVALKNIHGSGNVVSTAWSPYDVQTVGVIAPFPNPIPPSLDMWLLKASIQRTGGSGGLNIAALFVAQIQQGIGRDSVAAAFVSTAVLTVALWEGVATASTTFGVDADGNNPLVNIGMRIPRKGAIISPVVTFTSSSGAAADYECVLIVGLFPVALGQDACAF